jgi:hypothetical protein
MEESADGEWVKAEDALSLARFASLCILTHWDAEGCGGPPKPWPPEVERLVDEYGCCPLGHCSRCKQWAPLDAREHLGGSCATGWGCAEAGADLASGPRSGQAD